MYSKNSELPKSVRELPEEAQTLFRISHTSDWTRNVNQDIKDVGVLEASASKAAWLTVNKHWFKDANNVWNKKHDFLEVKEGINKLDDDYYSIKAFPVFKSGLWNGLQFSQEDLQGILDHTEIPVPLGIGHKGSWLLSQLDLTQLS